MVQVSVIASSSKGNCVLIRTEKTMVLVDAGITAKRIFEGMRSLNLDPEELDGIFITHEHGDHVVGLSVISKKLNTPIWMTPGTYSAVKFAQRMNVKQIPDDGRFEVGDIAARAIPISHDARQPVAFALKLDGVDVAIATDLGCVTPVVREGLAAADILLLESNHDLEMLRVGPYHWELKQRVMSPRGHLSNDVAAHLVGQLSKPSTVILGHLSENNNTPELVELTARRVVRADVNLLVMNPEAGAPIQTVTY